MTPIEQELNQIQNEHGGVLHPRDVVQYASDPETALHSRFEWDDSKAAGAHRLWQARQVISVHVNVLKPNTDPVRVFVSLKEDRQRGGGYRSTTDVLGNKKRRASLLSQALAELDRVQVKYRHLTELDAVFSEVEIVKKRRKPTASTADRLVAAG